MHSINNTKRSNPIRVIDALRAGYLQDALVQLFA
jgi:hypothetical protein